MEKVRFEAFNVEELRVLRRACYEAGAAFGDRATRPQSGKRWTTWPWRSSAS